MIQMSERIMQVRGSTAALVNSTRDELRRSPTSSTESSIQPPSDDDDESLGDDDDLQPLEEVDRTANRIIEDGGS